MKTFNYNANSAKYRNNKMMSSGFQTINKFNYNIQSNKTYSTINTNNNNRNIIGQVKISNTAKNTARQSKQEIDPEMIKLNKIYNEKEKYFNDLLKEYQSITESYSIKKSELMKCNTKYERLKLTNDNLKLLFLNLVKIQG